MAIKKSTKKTSSSSGLKITSTGFSDSKGSYNTAGKSVSSNSTPTRYTGSSGGVAMPSSNPTGPSTFGFMDGSSYNADGSQANAPVPSRYAQPTVPGMTPMGSPLSMKPTIGVVNEKKIREETRKGMQASIDAINSNYANLITQEKVQGEDRSGQTRAMNARSGTLGSDFGQAAQEKTTSYNKQQTQYLADQQNLQVQSVMERIEERASQRIQTAKQEALGKYQMDMDEFKSAKESARADLKTLAESGVDLNTLQPAQKAALFKQSGYDDPGMGELVYNAMKPKAKQIDYKTENIGGGRVLFYGVDPATGELKKQIVDMGMPDEFTMTIAPDGTPIAFNKYTGESQILGPQGQFAKPEVVDPLDAYKKKLEIQKLENEVGGGWTEDGELVVNRGEAQKINQQIAGSDSYKAVIKAQDAQRVVDSFEKAWNESGKGTGIWGPGRDSVQPAYKTAVLTLKEFFNLGVLNGPDLEQIEGILKNPYSFSSNIRGTDSVTESIRNIKEMIKSQTEDRYRDVIGQYENYSPEQITNLKELNRIYSGVTGNAAAIQEAQSFLGAPEGTQYGPGNPSGGSSGTNPKAASSGVTSLLTRKFAEGSVGGQCGDFARKVVTSFGADYPRLGDSLSSKMAAVMKHGTSPKNAGNGSVIVTKENPTYGHVAVITGRNAQGWIVAESNFKQSNKVSYGRVIPYNSNKIVGVINPTRE